MQEGQLDIAFEGYRSYWNYAQKKGYSGTAIFSRHEPLSVTYGLGLEEHDTEGRVITLEMRDFYLVTVYTPNSQDELRRLDYRMTWEDEFRAYLLRLDAVKPVIVCGDLNVSAASSPTCSLPDSPTRSAISIPTPRASIPGGPTASRPARRTPGGALTISSSPTAFSPDS